MQQVADKGCVVCGGPAEIHHITTGVGMGQRASNYQVIPLCPFHHRLGGSGYAIHAGKKTWEAKYGSEMDHLHRVQEELGLDVSKR